MGVPKESSSRKRRGSVLSRGERREIAARDSERSFRANSTLGHALRGHGRQRDMSIHRIQMDLRILTPSTEYSGMCQLYRNCKASFGTCTNLVMLGMTRKSFSSFAREPKLRQPIARRRAPASNGVGHEKEIAMQKSPPAANPDAYVAELSGWQRACVEDMRKAVRAASDLQEVVKWGHLVYLSNGPVLLIRAEEARVLLGFWRGQRLRATESRLKPGGKYEMATLELREGMTVGSAIVRRLTKEAVALNISLGNPTHVVKTNNALKRRRAKRARS